MIANCGGLIIDNNTIKNGDNGIYVNDDITKNIVIFDNYDAITGNLVRMQSSGKVEGCVMDDEFIGLCLSYTDTTATIQLHGYIEVPYTGTAPTINYQKLSASDTEGAVKVDTTNGREYLVVYVNTETNKVGFYL